jgi:hypothetical protein
MKRGLLAVLVMAAVAVPAAAEHSSTDFVATGLILVGDPVTRVQGGVSEIGSPCLGSFDPEVPEGAAQGVDGFWIQLPEGAAGHSATLTAADPNDVDAWFYTEDCSLIGPTADENAYSMATTDPEPNGNEEGTIPEIASWVAVDLYVGAAAEFTFTITGAGSGS